MIERKSTKQLIAESFVELAREKKIREITVNDIVSNCSVSPRTFYYHFEDKFALLEYVYEMQLRQATEYWGDYRRLLTESASIVGDMGEYITNATEKVAGTTDPLVRMARCSVRVYSEKIEGLFGAEALTEQVMFEMYYYNYLVLRAYADWADAGKPISSDKLVDYSVACMPRHLEPLFNASCIDS